MDPARRRAERVSNYARPEALRYRGALHEVEAEVGVERRRRARVAPRPSSRRRERGPFHFRKGGAVITEQRTHRAVELIPVTRERLADLETPVSAFAKLRALGGAFLLESAEGGERMGRYSFIGVAPRAVLTFREGDAGDPIAALREHLALYRRAPRPGLPRFSGGAVGFVGYEAARRFERLPLASHDPYAPWGLPEMVFGIYDTVVAFDHLRHTLTVLAHDEADRPGGAAR